MKWKTALLSYEQYLYAKKARGTYRLHSNILERFFYGFPKKSNVEDFCITEIVDYKKLRQKEGIKISTLRLELKIIRLFYKWLNKELKLDISNPVRTLPSETPEV